jgi:hypothetical protein
MNIGDRSSDGEEDRDYDIEPGQMILDEKLLNKNIILRKEKEGKQIGQPNQLLSEEQLQNQGIKMKAMNEKRATNSNPKLDYLTEDEDNFEWEEEEVDDGGEELAKEVNDIMDGIHEDVEAKEDLIEDNFQEVFQLLDKDQIAAQGIKFNTVRVRHRPKPGNFAESPPSTTKRKIPANNSKKVKKK